VDERDMNQFMRYEPEMSSLWTFDMDEIVAYFDSDGNNSEDEDEGAFEHKTGGVFRYAVVIDPLPGQPSLLMRRRTSVTSPAITWHKTELLKHRTIFAAKLKMKQELENALQ
jgi:hypothetical protein